jgi:hypothetical protein
MSLFQSGMEFNRSYCFCRNAYSSPFTDVRISAARQLKQLSLTIFFRDASKVSTNSDLKSWMYQGIQDTWHGRYSGEGNGDGYPCLCSSSWPEVLPWAWEMWLSTIQLKWKEEETSVRVFAFGEGLIFVEAISLYSTVYCSTDSIRNWTVI